MPIKIDICPSYLHLHWSGIITGEDLAYLFKELPVVGARCGFAPHVLHTMDPATELQLQTIDACAYSLRRTQTPIPMPIKAAFVAHTPVAVAISRTFSSLNGNPNLTTKSFLTEAQALAWLGAPTPDKRH